MIKIAFSLSIPHLYGALCLCVTVTPAESFDWGQYICSNNTAGAPVSCFKHVSKLRAVWVVIYKVDYQSHLTSCLLQAPMGKCWGDIEEGVRIEVINTDTNLSTKVYWIAEIIKLAGKSDSLAPTHSLYFNGSE